MIDSQSVKADAVVGSDSRGFSGGKLINGRKRHAVVDTLGLLLAVMVTPADTGDRTAAQTLLAQVADAHHRLELVWADGGYTGSLITHCLTALALVLAIVKRSDDMRGFVVLPQASVDRRAILRPPDAHPTPGARLRAIHQQRRGDDLLVNDPPHDPPPCPATPFASVNGAGAGACDPRRVGTCDHSHMSYDLDVWHGERPRDDEAALSSTSFATATSIRKT
ncbi:transposase [Streptomyces sp. NBC_01221]|uniref:transposase n=1 Tax=Streptomyces sp. NBC_01221 TaxID=2903782 RepID=UPI002B1E4E05|nr:transposase [Streptomyces sp. NBC_01221]